MNLYLLATEAATESATDPEKLLLQYIVYGAIIVVGIVCLILLKRASRLPKHKELKEQLTAFSTQLDAFSAEQNGRTYDAIKSGKKLLYTLDKLIYVTSAMAQKERDGDLNTLSSKLESAREDLSAYRIGKHEDESRLTASRRKVAEAIALLDSILERDAALKASKK